MKDPTEEILTGYQQKLTGQLVYSGETFPVFIDLPREKIFRYVYLANVNFSSDDTIDSNCMAGTLNVEVVTGGYQQQVNRKCINTIVNRLFEIVGNETFDTSNFYIVVGAYIKDINTVKEETESELILRRIINLGFMTQEK